LGQNWFDERRAILSIDTVAKNITLATQTNYPFRRSMRFYYYNVIDELDSAGEYLIDRDNGVLYFYPPSAISSNTDALLSVLNADLIALTGSNITFSGLLFFFISSFTPGLDAANGWLNDAAGFTLEATQSSAVAVRNGGSGSVVKNCVIRNVGGSGVSIIGGTDNVVMTSEIYNTVRTFHTLQLRSACRSDVPPGLHRARGEFI
jgi:hypothetical protein